ncbi:ArsR/SmtB family transcription factor [Kribbella deserti]|uniref:Helix-turn-helix domain-containing protein n=1 Tax=Kribbella deserti TaxID=1926257 RepID=A0ABV6QU81_9ACTN
MARTTFASKPDPLWELLLSLHQLQTDDAPEVFGQWRRRVRAKLGEQERRLLELAPPLGYSPDFLTPPESSNGLGAGLDALARTDRARLRAELDRLDEVPRWAAGLLGADGTSRLAQAMRGYFRSFVSPYWPSISRQVEHDLSSRAKTLMTGGLGGLSAELTKGMAWNSPVLEVDVGQARSKDLHLNGRGLRLIPSYFCWGYPITLRDPDLQPVLVYPVRHQPFTEPVTQTRTDIQQALGSLLGRTRAAVLRSISLGGCSTTELAQRVGISPASASEHARVLNQAGLISTRRVGAAVNHTIRPTGRELLGV